VDIRRDLLLLVKLAELRKTSLYLVLVLEGLLLAMVGVFSRNLLRLLLYFGCLSSEWL
jgi:hypothetical protein